MTRLGCKVVEAVGKERLGDLMHSDAFEMYTEGKALAIETARNAIKDCEIERPTVKAK